MSISTQVPPGFRFHPTEEELVDYYLRKKVASRRIDLDVIKDVELYKIEPWDLQDLCKIGDDEQEEWYFFSHKDKKYPTGTRTNRATVTGFWKATGRDKPIYLKQKLIGQRKTLVFYHGRAPNGQKSDWIMHEYRLESEENGTQQEEGWVVCRVFKKRALAMGKGSVLESPCWYDESFPLTPSMESQFNTDNSHLPQSYRDQILHDIIPYEPHHPLHLPQLESPRILFGCKHGNIIDHSKFQVPAELYQLRKFLVHDSAAKDDLPVDRMTDWRILDKFVAAQLSQDGNSKDPNSSIQNQSKEDA